MSTMPTATIDGIVTRYDVVGSGPPLLMFSPGGFDATLDKWSTLGVYAKTKMLEHLSKTYSCIIFDRREAGQSGGRLGGRAGGSAAPRYPRARRARPGRVACHVRGAIPGGMPAARRVLGRSRRGADGRHGTSPPPGLPRSALIPELACVVTGRQGPTRPHRRADRSYSPAGQ